MRSRRLAERVLAATDALFDGIRAWATRLLRRRAPLAIEAYLGYGDAHRLRFAGRVVRRRAFVPPDAAHPVRRNMLELLKRMFSGKQPRARLHARFEGRDSVLVADSEGYFELELVPSGTLAARSWPVLELELLHPAPRGEPVRAEARAMVPSPTARFGVISDIDDTVVRSNVAARLRMLWLLARSNAHTRKPFRGVAALYRALERGAGGGDGNPVFYVSSSPWNLYTPLVEFLRHQDIPGGPLMLRDFGDHTLFAMDAHGSHKLSAIERILAAFPDLPFVLIGDSGEQDPEIYAEVACRHPGRIPVAYIREVASRPGRRAAVRALGARYRAAGCELVLVADSAEAAVHAAALGLVAADAPEAVQAECAQDA